MKKAQVDVAPSVEADIVEDFQTPKEKRFLKFEEFFPPLNLTEGQESEVKGWLKDNLLKCKKYNDEERELWAKWRAVYTLSYVARFYPSMGLSATFASGLLCEKVLEAMDRMSRSVLTPRPLFTEDDKLSGTSGEDIQTIHTGEWLLHKTLIQDLKLNKELDPRGFFEFILDGSYILEADVMYERVPERTIRTYLTADELLEDNVHPVSQGAYDEALAKLTRGETPVRLLVETDVLTRDGMRVFYVNKTDHLIPRNVYTDSDLKFRGRRMYYTASDLELLASKGVNVYPQDKVDAVVEARSIAKRMFAASASGDKNAVEYVADYGDELYYDWASMEGGGLSAAEDVVPYKDTFALYRVTCKYGYKTKSDPKGKIPKWVVFDYSPEGDVILRAVTYPHFHESLNWFHFKLGYTPKSYYGFGFGARLYHDDQLASNIINIYMDSAALSTYTPFLSKHPDEGGRIPFRDGLGPFKIGYVNNIGDFQQLEIKPPPVALVQHLYPMLYSGAENKTSITSLTQGKTESADPRSPASKTAMLLGEASVGIDSMIRHWNQTGWEALAAFVWSGIYEQAIYRGNDEVQIEGGLPMMGIFTPVKLSLEQLRRKIVWKSQAASEFINDQVRKEKFKEQFMFFAPLISQLVQVSPMFFKYLVRWLWYSGEVLDVRGARFLLPSLEEMQQLGAGQAAGMVQGMVDQVKGGESIQNTGGENVISTGQQPQSALGQGQGLGTGFGVGPGAGEAGLPGTA